MVLKTEEDIRRIVASDDWMTQALNAAEALNLPDWWIGAGFLRNKVWNTIEGKDEHSNTDVDLVYFNASDVKAETDWSYDKKMNREYPFAEWEVRNQARMHYVNKFQPYSSTADGIAHWVETATCTAVKLENKKLKFLFCHGMDDLLNLVARPTSGFKSDELISTFLERIEKKKWQKIWPHLKIELS
jgi:hypothetical protein